MMGSGFDLTGLSPEDLQQLTIHAIQTSEECANAINQLGEAVQMLMERISDMGDHVNKLDDVLMKQLIGGLDELYQSNQHTAMIDGLKGRFGSMFDPHMDMIKDWYPDLDIYEKLGEEYSGMKGEMGDGFDEGAFDTRVKEIADALAAKAAKYKSAVAAEEPVAAVTTKETTVAPAAEAIAAEAPKAPDILETVKRLKAAKNPASLS